MQYKLLEFKIFATPKDIEKYFSISENKQRYYRDKLKLPYYKVGKSIFYRVEEVKDWFNKFKAGGDNASN